MIIFADNKKGAERAFRCHQEWKTKDNAKIDRNLLPLINRLYGDKPVYKNESRASKRWSCAFYVQSAPSSHFDLLLELNRQNLILPDGILCVAGSGHHFHGQRGRPWAAEEGNIHLCIHLSPNKRISHYHAGLPVLSAVSIVQAIDTIDGLEGLAEIKWVNDVLIEGKKVAGFLVHTQSVHDRITTIVLGIGLNVEKTPGIKPDVFAPKVGSLRDFLPSPACVTLKEILKQLLEFLDKNYGLLCSGQYHELLDFYRRRSAVIGREVRIFSDVPGKERTIVSSGIVEKIGDNLELWMEGQNKPVTEGSLAFASEEPADSA
jgi:BirA family biotin operon repressor/biotin-[acetyl-CoA-carboxylase] ligase